VIGGNARGWEGGPWLYGVAAAAFERGEHMPWGGVGGPLISIPARCGSKASVPLPRAARAQVSVWHDEQ